MVFRYIVDKEGVHSFVYHVGPHPRNPTRKSDLALGFFHRNILLVRKSFRAVLRNDRSAAEVIRPAGLVGLHSCGEEKFAT